MRSARLAKKPTFIPVVAGLVRDSSGQILLQQCLAHKRHAGLWEFPGGKVETGETPRFALCRELGEELGLEVSEDALDPAGFAEEAAVEGRLALVLFLYTCATWRGVPEPRDGQCWGWFDPAAAASLPMPPMDRALLAALFPGAHT